MYLKVDSIDRSAFLDATALIWGGSGNTSETSIKNPFINFHCMIQKADRPVVDTLTHITLSLPNWHSDTGFPGSRWLISCNHHIVE